MWMRLREGSGGGKQEFFSEVRVCSGMENDLAVLKLCVVCSGQKISVVKKKVDTWTGVD